VATPTGFEESALVVLRGNSGSGKSTVARSLREGLGRGIAIIGQDVVRRDILREKDVPGGTNIGLLETMVRYSLDHGYHVILEGILDAGRYGDMLNRLGDDHRGTTTFWYWDLSFETTLQRHSTKPVAGEFGEPEMRSWFVWRDLLPSAEEHLFDDRCTKDQAVDLILRVSGLAATPPALHPR